MHKELTQEFETISPEGHIIRASYATDSGAVECYVYHADSGDKIPASKEITSAVEASMRADSVARHADTQPDEWHQTIRELKLKQSRYLRQLIGSATDAMIGDDWHS
jgi:methyl coenzyme M reductase subunit C-like uncharacterized protein (methanogenesis marker protein 7)